jgi:hypothetical protein
VVGDGDGVGSATFRARRGWRLTTVEPRELAEAVFGGHRATELPDANPWIVARLDGDDRARETT